MAILAQTIAMEVKEPVVLGRLTLSASDSLTYIPGSRQKVLLVNATAGALTATFVGSAATTISPPGYGGTLSVSAGKAVSVAANTTMLVELDDISAYLAGNVTIAGGTGLIAHLYV